jgi:putative ABC transport system substrate-binding protein
MRRRQFLGVLIGAAVAGPFDVKAQSTTRGFRIGAFTGTGVMAAAYRAFLEELRRLGFSDGMNLTVDQRPPDQDPSALSAQAAEMIRSNVELIVVGTEPALKAALAASGTIPIVFMANNYDPIALGYANSLARPGGNVTGIVLRQTELAEKQVELLTQAFPGKSRLAVLFDSISSDQFAAAERQATLLRLNLRPLKLESTSHDFEAAFRLLSAAKPEMLLVLSSPYFVPRTVAELSLRYRLPAMFIFKAYTELGGLMSYGADPIAMYRQGAGYVAKILNGAKPADLPIEQPAKFELVVNLKTATALGIELPTAILLRADQVIE